MTRNSKMNVSGREVEFNSRARTKPADRGPYSPEAIEKLYDKSDDAPFRRAGPDGLITRKQHASEEAARGPQFVEDKHGEGYNPDVPLDWRRGGGAKHAEGYPGFDPVGNPKPAKGGGRITGSGRDIKESPFSAAYRRGAGEGFKR
jgi:hypothetical protein